VKQESTARLEERTGERNENSKLQVQLEEDGNTGWRRIHAPLATMRQTVM